MKIPNPKFIVFYNGMQNFPDRLKLRLSDAFEKEENARKLFENGVSIELISKSLEMTEEQIKEIVKDVVIA